VLLFSDVPRQGIYVSKETIRNVEFANLNKFRLRNMPEHYSVHLFPKGQSPITFKYQYIPDEDAKDLSDEKIDSLVEYSTPRTGRVVFRFIGFTDEGIPVLRELDRFGHHEKEHERYRKFLDAERGRFWKDNPEYKGPKSKAGTRKEKHRGDGNAGGKTIMSGLKRSGLELRQKTAKLEAGSESRDKHQGTMQTDTDSALFEYTPSETQVNDAFERHFGLSGTQNKSAETLFEWTPTEAEFNKFVDRHFAGPHGRLTERMKTGLEGC
jgi:hypothetical protein